MPAVNRTLHPATTQADINAAIYARVSLEEKDDQPGFSLPGQVNDCLRYAETYGMTVAPEHIFQDDFTGKSLHRPALDNLIDLLPTGKIQVLIVPRIDRLGRDAAEMFPFMKQIQRSGVKLCLVGTPPGQETDEYRLMLGMLAMFADYEHAIILKRMENGRRNRALAGYPRKQKPPYGLRWVEELLPDGSQYDQAKRKQHTRGWYEIHPEEAAIVVKIFHWYVVDGWPAYKIAQTLNALGIPSISTSRNYARRQPALSGWGRSSVHHILRNRDYLGTQVYGMRTVAKRKANGKPSRMALTPEETWIHVTIPALIDLETFEQAQERAAWNKRVAAKQRKHTYLLGQGRITCLCGVGMGGTLHQGRIYYRCNRQSTSPEVCHRQMSGKKLEAAVWREVKARFSDPQKAMELLYQETPDGQSMPSKGFREECERLEKVQRQAAIKLQRLEDAYYAGGESPDEYAAKKRRFTKEQDLATSQLHILRMQEEQGQQLQAHRAEHTQILETIAEELARMETLEEQIHVLNLLRLRIEYLPEKQIKIRIQPFALLGKNLAVVSRLDQQSEHYCDILTWTTAA
jgi:site-specific DNA recombinase